MRDVGENSEEDLRVREIGGGVGGVRAVVDNAVHVEIQVIERRDAVGVDQLAARGVALADPPEELGDAHGRW